MEILVTIPDTLTEHLQPEEPTAKHQLLRLLLEEAGAALYRAGKIAKMQAMAWLELEDREDFYTFLHAHHIPMTTLEVLQRDRGTSERLGFLEIRRPVLSPDPDLSAPCARGPRPARALRDSGLRSSLRACHRTGRALRGR